VSSCLGKRPLNDLLNSRFPNVHRKITKRGIKKTDKYLAGKETVFQWFVGQVARATKGKADMNVAKELLVKALEEKKK